MPTDLLAAISASLMTTLRPCCYVMPATAGTTWPALVWKSALLKVLGTVRHVPTIELFFGTSPLVLQLLNCLPPVVTLHYFSYGAPLYYVAHRRGGELPSHAGWVLHASGATTHTCKQVHTCGDVAIAYQPDHEKVNQNLNETQFKFRIEVDMDSEQA